MSIFSFNQEGVTSESTSKFIEAGLDIPVVLKSVETKKDKSGNDNLWFNFENSAGAGFSHLVFASKFDSKSQYYSEKKKNAALSSLFHHRRGASFKP